MKYFLNVVVHCMCIAYALMCSYLVIATIVIFTGLCFTKEISPCINVILSKFLLPEY